MVNWERVDGPEPDYPDWDDNFCEDPALDDECDCGATPDMDYERGRDI
jgi:hypothetical protein